MINIKGIIGQDYTFVDFLGAISGEKGNVIEIIVDSIGGLCDEGFAIYNTILETKKRGVKIVTRAVNTCSSIASIIFMAGDERFASCPLMIHNPWGGVEGDASEVSQYAKELQAIEKQLEEIYFNRTGGRLPMEVLSDLMDKETYISPEQAVALGFATNAVSTALAMYRPTNKQVNTNLNKNKMSKTDSKESLIDKARRLMNIGGSASKKDKPRNSDNKTFAMELQTITGGTLTVDREEGMPEVGDGARPNGVHELPEGLIITVTDDVITDIKEVSPGAVGDEPLDGETIVEKETVEELVQTIEELVVEVERLENEAMQNKAQSKTRDEMKILNAVALAGGYDAVFAKSTERPKSTYNVTRRSNANGKPDTASSESMKIKLEAARAKAKERAIKKGGRK